jgi:hypothetical protein
MAWRRCRSHNCWALSSSVRNLASLTEISSLLARKLFQNEPGEACHLEIQAISLETSNSEERCASRPARPPRSCGWMRIGATVVPRRRASWCLETSFTNVIYCYEPGPQDSHRDMFIETLCTSDTERLSPTSILPGGEHLIRGGSFWWGVVSSGGRGRGCGIEGIMYNSNWTATGRLNSVRHREYAMVRDDVIPSVAVFHPWH